MRAFALGGFFVAGELYIPGARTIFLPADTIPPKILTLNFELQVFHFDDEREAERAANSKFFEGMQWTRGEQKIFAIRNKWV
jgi:hypothetical protein